MEIILDMICAEYGSRIIEVIDGPQERGKIEATITKSLGVLQEDGVYAFAIYTKSKSGDGSIEKKTAGAIFEESFNLLKDPRVSLLADSCADFLNGIRATLADNIDHLLLAKELLERTLVYARYHAKAFPSPQSSPQRGEDVEVAKEAE